jgi:hypothetical protein
MRTEIGGLDRDDGLTVPGRLLRDPPQRVQPADAHIQLVAAELVDRPGEPVGDVTLLRGTQPVLAHPQLPPRGKRPEEHDKAADDLQKRRTDGVHRTQPVPRVDARPGEIMVDHHTRKEHESRTQEGQSGRPGDEEHSRTMPAQPVAVRIPRIRLHGNGSLGATQEMIKTYSMERLSVSDSVKRLSVTTNPASQRTTERATRNPTSSTWKVGWLRRRTEDRQLQCSSNQPPPRSTR